MKRKMYANMLMLILYVFMSAIGLILIKKGLNGSSFLFSAKTMSIQINWILFGGICLYVLSFITSLIVMNRMPLNVYYPISSGVIYIITGILSYFFLHEKVNSIQLLGMVIIFIGIIVINIGKGN